MNETQPSPTGTLPTPEAPGPSPAAPDSAEPAAPGPSQEPAAGARGLWARLRRWFRQRLTTEVSITFEFLLGVAALLVWLGLFAVGYSLSSAGLINALNDERTGAVRGLVVLVQVMLVHTVTNVGLLSLLAGIIGTVARRFTDPRPVPAYRMGRYLTAMVGSFLIFLITTSGAYALLSLSLSPPPIPPPNSPESAELKQAVSQAQFKYQNLAAFTSLLCLVEGYAPFALAAVVSRIQKMLRSVVE